MINRPTQTRRIWLRWLLILPGIGLLWPPFYNIDQPELIGIPFFYWYQLLWVILTAILTAVLYKLKA
ncbi:MAG: DUF3311 domain-containing protein [Chroococcidiopsidaceae cyanobacterium CP_BM_RX_35]|nr:DUF3311 domain-containing protein [Chroococcidiopsidaceae cyanobacterium CP_BM_RX_35]